jgi:hypothetical protein
MEASEFLSLSQGGLDLLLSRVQANAQFDRHVLVLDHLTPRNGSPHPGGLEHVLLSLGRRW